MPALPPSTEPRPLTGIALAAAGYCLFSIQDATVKWLVETYEVPQILFLRSVTIVAVAMLIAQRQGQPPIWRSRNKGSLAIRALLLLVAWFSYYSASRYLGLADLTTMYFGAPVMGVVLSMLILKERVNVVRWLAVIAGFVGVVVAADPSGRVDLVPTVMVLFAALCWAWSTVLIRLINRSESTANQMIVTSGLFVVVCGAMLPFLWKTPDLTGWGLMLGLGLTSGIAQYLLYEGYRHAPASAIAPVEYTGLVWAFIYGYAIWGDIPKPHVFAGAFLIACASLGLVLWEARSARRLRAA
ncbi:DMT family transporter [Labrys monachus]|uniref:S-adenosylmethionine uptake transporter n=1 Tax=Labrys monachus TaxID=217067 RepID=A0ABU0FP32_9HYPH|nr:DMT family transporter [Labrys monachus]MDQ0396367.1 S-adenosylmethionine uptake transporter [Labrys monachus]